jgi:hypothetical protein
MGSVELSSLIPSMGSGGVFPLISSTGSMGLSEFILRYRARAWWSFPPLNRAWARGSLGCSFIPPGTRALSRGRLILFCGLWVSLFSGVAYKNIIYNVNWVVALGMSLFVALGLSLFVPLGMWLNALLVQMGCRTGFCQLTRLLCT